MSRQSSVRPLRIQTNGKAVRLTSLPEGGRRPGKRRVRKFNR
jgi:hypothetical protein